MNMDHPLDFKVNKETKTVTITKTFAAERTLVWEAYTNSELLDQWWAPKPFLSRTKAMDFEVGSDFQIGARWHSHDRARIAVAVVPEVVFVARRCGALAGAEIYFHYSDDQLQDVLCLCGR